MDGNGRWTRLTHFEDGIVSVKFGSDQVLYMLSRKDAPRGKILRLPLTQIDLAQAKIFIPETSGPATYEAARASIEDFASATSRFYVIDNIGGPSRVRVFDNDGRILPALSLPPISRADEIVPTAGGDALFPIETYVDPPAWYRYSAVNGKVGRTALFETSPIRFDDAEVVREFATSKDGTRIPLNIIRLKTTKLDGATPVLLTGYGGFGQSEKPTFEGYIYGIWAAHLAGSGRCFRGGQSARRWRVWRGMASRGQPHSQTECLR
jgi:prolyl oligopeptidase